MKIRLALLIALVLLIAPFGRVSAADQRPERIALVIGNAKYPDSETPLKDPVNDARDIAEELKRDNFNVEIGENLTGDGMRRALDRFYGRIKPGSAALLFFSGFGVQSNRQTYLIPVDAQIWTEADVRRDGFSLESILGEVNSRGAGVKIALLDASRRNPFERRFRSFSAGLSAVSAPNGTLVMYSAGTNSVVSDSGGDHSLFVGELLKEIRVPGLAAEETLNRTRVGVTRASRSEQVPWISSSLAEDFSFIPGSKTAAIPPPPAPSLPPPRPLPQPTEQSPPPSSSPLPPSAPTAPSQSLPSSTLPPSTPANLPKPVPSPTVIPPVQEAARPPEPDLSNDPTVKALTERIERNANDANALYRRGQVYASKGAYTLAVKDFDATIRLNPRDVEAYNNRCWVKTVIGQLSAALSDCNEALRLRPNFVDALDSRGLANLKSGQAKSAIADFDAALRINPRLTSSLYGRGLARQRSGLVTEGDVDIANAKAMDPNITKEYASYGVQ